MCSMTINDSSCSRGHTFARAQDEGVGEEQQGVVEEALQHGRPHPRNSQVLAAHRRAADQQGQNLTHHHGLQQTPGGTETTP